jgi:hypothetical protein
MQNVRRVDAMQNHVHDTDDVRQRFLFLAVESFLLKELCFARADGGLPFKIFKRFASESRRANRAIVNCFSHFGRNHFDNRFDQRACNILRRCVRRCPCS